MRFVIAVLVCCTMRLAGAQQPSPTSEAERLFQEGLALFEAKKFDEACVKFEQSIKKNPRALGTLMNLGRCNERRGKVATALALYQEAFDRASESGADGARDKAQERIAVLSSQVPVVVIKRAGPPIAGEKLVVDDKVIANDKTELQVDPGKHTFVLTAPGRLPFEKSVNVNVSDKTTLELPVLELPKERTVVRRVGSTRRTAGTLLAIGGGAVALVTGGIMLYAKRDYDKQFEGDPPNCGGFEIDGKPACNEAGQARTERDRNIVTAASIVGAVGVAAAVAGLTMWLTAPRERTHVVPTGGAGQLGLAVLRRF